MVDGSGNVTITGEDTTSSGGGAGFVERFDTTGHTVWTTSVSGTPAAIAVDTTGNLYVTGIASPKFQATPGAFNPGVGAAKCSDKYAINIFPCSDAFVLKLSSDGKRTIYATWLGGTLSETPWDIAVGADGSAYIVGETTSEDFPVTPGAGQPAPGGTVNLGPLSFGDGFAARLDPAGQRLIYGTYLGGKGGDALLAIAIDPKSGNAFVAGKTEDANTQMMPGARTDAMFAILSATGTLIRKARVGNPETPEWGISASISPDRHYFSGLCLSNEVLELSPETLEPIRRANLRTGTAPAIFALPGGLVEVSAPGGSLKTNIFLVPAGKPTIGALYLAQYDFRRASQPAVTAIVNAASYLQGRQFGGGDISLAANEIFTIFGEQLQLPVRVSLAGRDLPILYAGQTQINTLVPNDIPLGSSEIAIESAGTVLGRYPVEIARAVPALFVNGGAAPTIAAAINQDGTINSREHPARPGSVVVLFGTGLGRTTSDGFLAEHLEAYGPGGPGGGMEILYAGVAPGLAGVQQVNVRVHPNTLVAASSPYVALLRVVFGSAATFERTQDDVGIWVGAP